MSDQFGCGRGGRGALLKAALMQQSRRPGQSEESSSSSGEPSRASTVLASASPSSESPMSTSSSSPDPTPVPMGRGALLKQLLQLQKTSQVSTPNPSLSTELSASSQEPSKPPVTFGRGMLGRGSLQQFRPTPPPSSLPSPAPTPSLAPPQSKFEPPVTQFRQMQVKEFRGTAGKEADLEVNYVRLQVHPGKKVQEYHVDYIPAVDSKNMRFKLINSDESAAVIGRVKVFDGSKLYLPLLLAHQVVTIQTKLPTDGSIITISIKHVKQSLPQECVHLYNVLFRRIMKALKMTQVGRNYFDPLSGINVPQHKLEVWPGFITAIAEYEGGLLLNCDASFRVLRNITAREVLYDLYSHSRQDYKDQAFKALVGCVVLTRYNNKTYRIDDIAWDLKPTCTFRFHTGDEISYCNYYKREYDIDIQDLEQPLLIHRPKPRKDQKEQETHLICLVPELCHLTGLTDEMRSDFRVMKDIATHTRINPQQRQLTLSKFIENVKKNQESQKLLTQWGVELNDGGLKMKGRILPDENIFLKTKSYNPNGTADWSRFLSQDSVITAVDLDNWIVIHARKDTKRTQEFIAMMSKVCPSMGIKIQRPIVKELPNDSTDNYLRALRETINRNVKVVIIVFPTSRDDKYSAVKRLCCVDMPIASQVIISNTIAQPQKLRSVTQKIALQINCKLGGELWALKIPMDNIMVCGVDVFHDMVKHKRSVLGFVASLNTNLTRWYSKVAFQDQGQEMVNCLEIAMLDALMKYYEVNHKRPDRIFLFRDGVGDGQLKFVSEYEIDHLMQCFSKVGPDYKPSLGFIVVQKRINTRIFADLNGNLDNPLPGTIADHTVTRADWYDFFLVSQKVRQGTVAPTHYIVLHNDTSLTPDHMQRLTYKLTHLYYNWPGTVRVPAPCQYAHKLAHLVGENITKAPNPCLADKLFYL